MQLKVILEFCMGQYDELEKLQMEVSRFDVNAFFPEEYNDELCYLEYSKGILLKEIQKMIATLGDFTLRFIKLFNVNGYTPTDATEEENIKIKFEALKEDIYGADPFANLEVSIPDEFIDIKNKLLDAPVPIYVSAIKALDALAWKHETLGGNSMIFRNNMEEACKELYLNKASEDIANENIGSHTRKYRRGNAVLSFEKPEKGMELSRYAEEGGRMLHGALALYCANFKIAEARGDYIQAFRGFRKSVRVRKRFGLRKNLASYFIDREKDMMKLSLEQMGSKFDNLELRKYEVKNRVEQELRNLKYKTIII